MGVRSGVSKGGSKAIAAVSGRAPQQHVAIKQVLPPRDLGSRSAPGQARDQSGRFITGGSKLVEGDPVPVKLLDVQDAAAGVRDEEDADSAADSEEENEVADLDSDQQSSSAGDEVSDHDSGESDHVSSSSNTEFDIEEDKELE